MTIERIMAWASGTVVAVSVIAGLLVLGAPDDERARRFDDRRVSDLQRLAMVLRRAYARDGAMPASLDELVDGITLDQLPRDPRTETPYAFRAEDEDRFELCADFDRASEGATDAFWAHGAGRHCFSFDARTGSEDAFLGRPYPIRPQAVPVTPGA